MPQEPGSPEWWLRRLHGRIISRRTQVQLLHDYYDGEHRLLYATEKFLAAFGGMFREFSDNWCEVVVDATEERLNVEGFRFGDNAADTAAWSYWQANEMDAQSQLGHSEALQCGEAYATVWYRGDNDPTPEITVESPVSAIVECHPKKTRQRLAGLRMYLDEWGYEHAELFLPKRVHVFRSKTRRDNYGTVDAARVHWVIDDSLGLDLDEAGTMRNPLNVVPMVPLPNRPRLAHGRRPELRARSELNAVIPVQDAVNKVLADMIVTAGDSAYPQRYMLGMEELPKNEAGQDVNPFTPDKRVWVGEGDASKMKVGEFTASDLQNYVTAIEMLINHIASISRTPPHYLSASADRLSGESIKAAETGLVAKCKRKMKHFGEAWEEVIRLTGAVAGNQAIARAADAETIWADPESRTESQHVDSVAKKKDMGVPWAQLMEDLGYTPTQIERMRTMRAQDVLEGLFPEEEEAEVAAE